MRMLLEQLDELPTAGDVEHPEARAADPREVQDHEAQGQRLGIVGAKRLVDDRAVMGLADDQSLGLGAALDHDLLLEQAQWPALAVELVAVALDPLDEQVHDVRHDVRERPGNVVVLAQDHAGRPGSVAPRQNRSPRYSPT